MEIMQAIKALSEHMDERFEKMENKMNERFDQVWQELNLHSARLEQIDNSIERIDNHIIKNMVTKNQFNSLVGVLRRKNVISEFDAEHVVRLSVL